jgi:pimeloyl-ACP methyl ester carboxylesterase
MAREMPQLPGVRHRFVNAGDLKTHVAVSGEGDPVVLLHGWPEHWYAWRHVIPLLAEHHKVFAPDLRGFGWTDIAWKGFDKENMAEDVIRLLDALELDRVRVVGHDWGGWIGCLMALRHPGRVRQLVVMGATPPWPRPTPRNVIAARGLWYMVGLAAPFVAQRLLQRHPGFLRGQIRKRAVRRGGFSKEDLRIYVRDLRSPTRARAAALLHRTFLLRELVPVVAGRYRKLRLEAPTLVLHGQGDRVVPARLSAKQDRHADDLRVEVVPDAGHFLPEEQPDLVAEKVIEFFQESARPAAVGSE